MITPSDFIRIDYTPDLTLAGIAYACRSLAYTYNRMGGSAAHRMRRIVIGKAVELAFRRRCSAQGIPHDNLARPTLQTRTHYDLLLAAGACDIHELPHFCKNRIRELNREPSCLLDAFCLRFRWIRRRIPASKTMICTSSLLSPGSSLPAWMIFLASWQPAN